MENLEKYIKIATQSGYSKTDALAWATERMQTEEEKIEKEKEREQRIADRNHEKEKLDIEVVLERERAARISKEVQQEREKLASAKETLNHELMLEQGKYEREKVLIDQKADQERATMVAKQKLDLELFHQTEGRLSMDGNISNNSANSQIPQTFGHGSLKLPNFTDNDDIGAYLIRFEKLAEITSLARDQWALHLGTLLTGYALKIFSSLPVAASTNYQRLKSALLQGFSKTPDSFRNE